MLYSGTELHAPAFIVTDARHRTWCTSKFFAISAEISTSGESLQKEHLTRGKELFVRGFFGRRLFGLLFNYGCTGGLIIKKLFP